MTLVGRGNFTARLIDINLKQMWIQRFYETVPRVTHTELDSDQAIISFCARAGSPLFWSGVEMKPDWIVWHGEGQHEIQRSTGSVCWGAISLPIEAMWAANLANADRDRAPAGKSLLVAPTAAALARLQFLHAAISELAESDSEALSNPVTAHAAEQALMEASAGCLTGAHVRTESIVLQHRTLVMRRFRRALERRPDEPIYIPELCAEIGVSDRTLRACCQAQLGVGPHRYLLLRRLHLARRALLGGVPPKTTITQIATRYGFWQFGRFARDYRLLFGELPSATVARRC